MKRVPIPREIVPIAAVLGDCAQAGKTLLFVSHGGETVRQLCDRAIWLDHGKMLLEGSPAEVLDAYSGPTG